MSQEPQDGQEPQEKPGWAERMVATGDSIGKAGSSTQSAGCSVTAFVISLLFLAVIGFVFWAVAC